MAAGKKSQFIYVFEAVRPELITDPGAWTDEDIRIAEDHVDYLRRATEEGTVIMAGRSLDGKGPALVVFEADSLEDARRFMARDPFVAEGLMRANVHPFRAALLRQPLAPPPESDG
ncbi:MAG: YciI family protein [Anaerolineae bacterium]|jgi:uncharacterized protein YciI